MKNIKLLKFNKITVFVLLACSVVFAALQSILLVGFYDAPMRLYAHSGTVIAAVFNTLLFIFVMAVILLFRFTDFNDMSDEPAKVSVPARIFALLTAAALLADGIYGLLQQRKPLIYTDPSQVPGEKQTMFTLITVAISFIAFIYPVLVCFAPKGLEKVKTFLGCVTVIWHIMYLLAIYFDMTGPLNDPIRLLNQFGLVAMMMYLTAEIRYLCKIPKKGMYIGISIAAFTMLLCASVANIAYMISIKSISDTVVLNIYALLSAGYILTRLISQINQKQAMDKTAQ